MTFAGDCSRGFSPSMTGLAAAMRNSIGAPLSPNTSAISLLPAAPMKVAVAGVKCRFIGLANWPGQPNLMKRS